MTVQELKKKLIHKDAIQLIDLREEYEFEDGSICDTNMPMAEVFNLSLIHI